MKNRTDVLWGLLYVLLFVALMWHGMRTHEVAEARRAQVEGR